MTKMPSQDVDAKATDKGRPLTHRGRLTREHIAASQGVLVLGKDEAIRELASRICNQEGWHAATATLLEDARAMLATRTFSVALVTGPDAGKVVTELGTLRERDPNMCMVVVSEDRCGDQDPLAAEDGTCVVFSKPVSEAELRHALRHTIAERYWQQQVSQTEDALRASEAQYRSIFEHAVEGIFQLSTDGQFLIANASLARMLGYASPAALTSGVQDVATDLFVHPERAQELKEALERQEDVRGFEVECARQDGKPVWLSINARVGHDRSEARRYYEGTAEDITERKRDADRLARINECLLRFSNAPQENINRLTRLCGELLGGDWALYSRLEEGQFHLTGRWRTPPDLAPVTDPQGHICSHVMSRGGERAWLVRHLPDSDFAQSDPCVLRYRLRTYIGQAVRRGGEYIGAICVLFCDDFVPSESDRRLLGIVASAIGVEEARRQADQALRRAFHQTRVILESLPSAILVVMEDLTILSANALASRFFDDGRCSLVGRSLREILPEAELTRCEQMFRMSPSAMEQSPRRQDREFQNGPRIIRYQCFPVVLGDRERRHVGLALWDVTEEKQMQDQLVQAEKLASLGTMVSGMAHEVNNPAQAILGLAEIMMEETAPEKIQEYAADIAGYAQHVASVVRDFACYARSSSREGEFDVDINQRLVDAVKMVRRGPHFGYVEVVTNLQSLPAVRARRSEIEQIFVNIIGNAVQAMQGRGRLTLSTGRHGDKILASICDTGPGIPKPALNKIFDPFFTTKEPGKGTGLGLSIVYKIITKYGGKIRVESQEGRGTTFYIEFPIGASSPSLQGGA